jgi:hypothetical protein
MEKGAMSSASAVLAAAPQAIVVRLLTSGVPEATNEDLFPIMDILVETPGVVGAASVLLLNILFKQLSMSLLAVFRMDPRLPGVISVLLLTSTL